MAKRFGMLNKTAGLLAGSLYFIGMLLLLLGLTFLPVIGVLVVCQSFAWPASSSVQKSPWIRLSNRHTVWNVWQQPLKGRMRVFAMTESTMEILDRYCAQSVVARQRNGKEPR
jgi:hypothetical protein